MEQDIKHDSHTGEIRNNNEINHNAPPSYYYAVERAANRWEKIEGVNIMPHINIICENDGIL